jgi:hypothetical protein
MPLVLLGNVAEFAFVYSSVVSDSETEFSCLFCLFLLFLSFLSLPLLVLRHFCSLSSLKGIRKMLCGDLVLLILARDSTLTGPGFKHYATSFED